jgi:hypothetical protein
MENQNKIHKPRTLKIQTLFNGFHHYSPYIDYFSINCVPQLAKKGVVVTDSPVTDQPNRSPVIGIISGNQPTISPIPHIISGNQPTRSPVLDIISGNQPNRSPMIPMSRRSRWLIS